MSKSKKDFDNFKSELLNILDFIIEKPVDLAHYSKVYLTSFIAKNYDKSIEPKILKIWNHRTLWDQVSDPGYKHEKYQIPKLLNILKSEGIDCNDYNIPFEFKIDEPEPKFTPKKISESSNINQKEPTKFNENTPLITRVKEYINNKYEIRLDQVRNVIEVRQKDSNSEFKKAEYFESDLIVELMENGYKGISNIVKILLGSSFIPKYHPIKNYFESLPKWDKVDRIKQLSNYLDVTSENRNQLDIQFKKHLIRCVASVFIPNYFNKHCFVLVGTKQSMFKTSFIRFLCPDLLKNYCTDNVLEWKDKDANIALGSNWIINLDELANLNRDETNSLKATLSRDLIKVRRPYDRNESEIPRLANFFGSTNDLNFLTDLTGNVRWICFRILNIDPNYNTIDIDQLWSQVYFSFVKGEEYQLTREELHINEDRNSQFMVSNTEFEVIQKYIIPALKGVENDKFGFPKFANTTELVRLLKEKSGLTNLNTKKIGQSLQANGFLSVSERRKSGAPPIKGYWYYEIDNSKEDNF